VQCGLQRVLEVLDLGHETKRAHELWHQRRREDQMIEIALVIGGDDEWAVPWKMLRPRDPPAPWSDRDFGRWGGSTVRPLDPSFPAPFRGVRRGTGWLLAVRYGFK
jgi:hypothetical protein